MKKIFAFTSLLILCTNSFSQTCEQKKEKLFGVTEAFSAGFLYNTYGLIGSIADGHTADAYDPQTTVDLLEAQKRMCDNMIKIVDELQAGNTLDDKNDSAYISGVVTTVKGLKKQAELLLSYVKTKAKQKL